VGIGGTKILADPIDSTAAFCTFLSHPLRPPLVLRTGDGGTSWQDVTGNLLGQSVNTIAVDPDRPSDWYAGTAVGVWHSGDGGTFWRPYGYGLPYAMTLDLAIQQRSRKLRVATHGRGIWEAVLRGGTTPSEAEGVLVLERASSNPGRGVVLFRYAGRGAGALELRVFAPTGRLVSRLAVDPADGFVRTVSWDTRSAGSGVYIAVLESGRYRVSRKVVVLR
ncbi:MAG TPA: T9SS type A sorting domain-containing protein, partial [Candidatus Eisenbacteria bacterium]